MKGKTLRRKERKGVKENIYNKGRKKMKEGRRAKPNENEKGKMKKRNH